VLATRVSTTTLSYELSGSIQVQTIAGKSARARQLSASTLSLVNVKEVALERIKDHTARVGVIGLGYVGLPFLVEKAKVGFHVTGIDNNPARVEKVARGENYIKDVKDEELRDVVARNLVNATTDFAVTRDLDVIVICVPTPLTKNLVPDLQYVEKVTRGIAPFLKRGALVSLESTTYPGTTEELIQPILEENGFRAGTDFYLCHSPERVDPGNKRYTTKNTNKVVGGADADSLEVAVAFYEQAIEQVVPVSSAKAAELVKCFENTFRAVNIALVNELMLLCDRMDLNVWEVLDAAFTKPFGIMPFYPGPGVGGHCIPLDPHYLEWKAREFNFSTRFIALAGETNRRMPSFVVSKAMRLLSDAGKGLRGSRVLLLGIAYKRDLDDYRESPAINVYMLLEKAGALVSYFDPLLPEFSEHGWSASSIELTDVALTQSDLVIVTTDHSSVDYTRVVELSKLVLDTRNATKSVTTRKDNVVLL
jgi:UDP-N-acetyl-D-glucosamine dehydrogenase